ncbi:MAG: type II toxin-antitoxin system HicA family toxin [Betaproteobacteria bacterium]|nr:type II toxin-antitoxin system HicA family toxin [Betaproteobacteria bacterium]
MKQLSGRALVAILRRHGWRLDRVRGSHHVMVKPGRPEIITVPVHGNTLIKTGLLLAILRIAGVDRSAM